MSTLPSPRLLYLLRIATIIQGTTSALSIVGSSVLLTTLFRTKGARRKVHCRLLVFVSIFDLVFSIAYGLGPVPVPKEVPIPGASGTVETCSAQGFFRQWGGISNNYLVMLLAYYVLVVRYNWPDGKIAKYVEPFMHCVAWIVPTFSAIYGVVLGVFNPIGMSGCWTSSWPPGCDVNPQINCIRGADATAFLRRFNNIPSLTSLAVMIFLLLVLIITVVQQRRKAIKLLISSRAANSITNHTSERGSSSVFEDQSREVQTQCLLYGFSATNSILWVNVTSIIRQRTGQLSIWSYYMTIIFLPLQGMFNCVIFLRPRFLQRRKGGEGVCEAVGNIIWNPSSSVRRSASNNNARSSKSSRSDPSYAHRSSRGASFNSGSGFARPQQSSNTSQQKSELPLSNSVKIEEPTEEERSP